MTMTTNKAEKAVDQLADDAIEATERAAAPCGPRLGSRVA